MKGKRGNVMGGGFFDGVSMWFVVPFMIVFVGIILLFIVGIGSTVVKARRENRNNEAAGLTTMPARVFGKREEMRGGGEFRVRTIYYLAFELDGGERKEFEVPGELYGLMAEGDRGTLRFMGTKFKGFERSRNA
ncbi:hypothetical protein B9G55_20305 [Saccharibacillus sp. O16]|nr:hypothetical protein B9G55_20305 [Saccharibacillus sp. O16]